MKKTLSAAKNGLITGFVINLAIGPLSLFVIGLTLQKTLLDGLMGALALTLVVYIYIALAVFGVSKLLENKKVKQIFGMISAIVLVIFGAIIIKGAIGIEISEALVGTKNLLASFVTVFILAISNPLSIVLFTGLFSTKAIEHNYVKRDLYYFGFGVGLATFSFTALVVLLISIISQSIPIIIIQILNILVGIAIIGYGVISLNKLIRK
jgi:threonine/homoserine/homoserine lactone efflux protein